MGSKSLHISTFDILSSIIFGCGIAWLVWGYSTCLVVLALLALLAWTVSFRLEYGVWFIMIGIFIFSQLAKSYAYIPRFLGNTHEIMLYTMCGIVFLRRMSTLRFVSTPIDFWVTLVIFISVFSAILNATPFIKFMLGMRHYFNYILLFYLLVNIPVSERFVKQVIRAMFILALLSGPLALIERHYLKWTSEDISAGFMSSGSFVLFGTALMCLLFARIGRNGLKVRYSLVMVSIVLTALIAETKAFFFFTPICLIFQFRTQVFRYLKLATYGLLFVIIILLSVNFSRTFHPSTDLYEYFWNPIKAWGYLSQDTDSSGVPIQHVVPQDLIAMEGNLSRITKIKYTAVESTKSFQSFLVGYGLGSVTPHVFLGYREDPRWIGAGLNQVQISKTLMEIGFTGFIVFIIIFFVLYRINERVIKKSPDEYWQSISLGFRGILCLFVIGVVYNPIWYVEEMAFVFWFLSAAIVGLNQKALES